MNISALVGLYNNLDYTQHFYKTFREVYPEIELVFVSYGSTDGTHKWLSELKDSNTKIFYEENRKTFSDTYNKAAEIATKEYVCFLHNDIIIAPGFLENIEKHLHPNNVVSYTTIEPPIFSSHERPGKIIKDFGVDLDTFNNNLFPFIDQEQEYQKNKTEPGVTFFMSLSRKVLLNMGGFDNIFNPYFSEDDDFIRRLKLQGLNCFTSLDAICYHFVSKTSRFSEEAKAKTSEIENNSNRTYLRKWGSYNSINKFDIGFIINNCDYNILYHLEPWCETVYTDYIDYKKYIESNQHKTWYDLNERVKPYDNEKHNNILVQFDALKLNQNNFNIIQNLQNILGDVEPGEYEIDIFKISVINPTNYIDQLIFIQK